MDHSTAYIGDTLFSPRHVGRSTDTNVNPDMYWKILDDLSIDVDEKYLEEIYNDDNRSDLLTIDKERSGCPRDEPEPEHLRSSSMLPPPDARVARSSLPLQHENERTQQRGKELAWQKVRQHLIEEEIRAANYQTVPSGSSSHGAAQGGGRDRYETVKLLDSLARLGREEPATSKAKYPPRTFMDRAGTKLSQIWHRSHASSGSSSSSMHSSPFHANVTTSPATSSRNQVKVQDLLEHISVTCHETKLPETAVRHISSHLNAIHAILDENTTSEQPQQSHVRQFSNTESSTEQSDSDATSHEFMTDVAVPTYSWVKVAVLMRHLFSAFSAAQDLKETIESFHNLLAKCHGTTAKGHPSWQQYHRVKGAVYNKLGFRQRQLFKFLDARLNLDVYKQKPGARTRVCIIGAGPVGLRAAVELALLGCQVSVVEKRTKFSRENMLHLWPWVVQDMASLGAKVLFPKFCKSKTYFHVSTRQLQLILLKVALVLGVNVHISTAFEAILHPHVEAQNRRQSFYSIKTEPPIPQVEYTAILGASGTNDVLAKPAGIKRFIFCQNESLGIVCYFPNLESSEETKVKEFSWTAQAEHKMLDKMRDVGLDLENIMYFRGEMHYLVMTPKRHNLVVRGVVKHNHLESAALVAPENINRGALHAFVHEVVKFVGICRKAELTRVNVFDFSSLTRAEKAASILTSHGKKLYVGLMGDSLLEPVWYDGLGTCRGFLSALDGAWMIAQIGKTTDKELLADREWTYQITQRLSGQHRKEMQTSVRKYTVDPRSRYTVEYPCAL